MGWLQGEERRPWTALPSGTKGLLARSRISLQWADKCSGHCGLPVSRADKGGLQWRPTRRVGDLPANRQGAVSLSRPPDARGAPAWVLSPGWRVFAPAKGQAGAARAALAHGRSCRQWTAVLEAMAWGMAWRSDAFPLPRETDVQSSAKSRRPTGPKGGLSPPILQIRCDTAGGWLIRGRLGHRGNSLCSWTNTERNIPRADAYRLSDQCRP